MKTFIRILACIAMGLLLTACFDDPTDDIKPTYTTTSPSTPGYIQQMEGQQPLPTCYALTSYKDSALVYADSTLKAFCGGSFRFQSFVPVAFTNVPEDSTLDPNNYDNYTTKCNNQGLITSWTEMSAKEGVQTRSTGVATYSSNGQLLTLKRSAVTQGVKELDYFFTLTYSGENPTKLVYHYTNTSLVGVTPVVAVEYDVELDFSYTATDGQDQTNYYRQFVPLYLHNLMGIKFQQLMALGYFGKGSAMLPTSYTYSMLDVLENKGIKGTRTIQYTRNNYNLLTAVDVLKDGNTDYLLTYGYDVAY